MSGLQRYSVAHDAFAGEDVSTKDDFGDFYKADDVDAASEVKITLINDVIAALTLIDETDCTTDVFKAIVTVIEDLTSLLDPSNNRG